MGFGYVDLPLPGRSKVVDLEGAERWEIPPGEQDGVFRHSACIFRVERVIRSRDGRYFWAGPTPCSYSTHEHRAEATAWQALGTLARHGLATDLPPDLEALARGEAPAPAAEPTPEAPVHSDDLVTLDQAAGMVHKSKRTLERFKTKGELPAPTVEGGGGKADLFDWQVLRPWLVERFGINLPEAFPATRRR